MPVRFILVATAVFLVGSAINADEVDFNRDVRPILSDACFTCHGPDSGQRQADLRLDLQKDLFRTVDGISIVDSKTPSNSEILKRITSTDPDVVMPPPDGGRQLTAKEKSTIDTWVKNGAPWKGHWAYIPPQKPDVPAASVSPTGNDIDRFINHSLNSRDVKALKQADATPLIRRLSFDLTGLPPSADDVAKFRSNPSPESWAKFIDQQLASYQYAERMTAFWLDLVRYADTNGIHGDNHRDVWMYRDYVIKAFHGNMPFDRFTTEQLAGDLLPNATDEQKVASGYNRLLMTTREGGAQAKEYLAKYSADRVRNASTVWMGATIGCCECHDHKFDPYSIKDFYKFAAFFADIQDVAVGTQPQVKMPSRDQKQKLAKLDIQLAELRSLLDTQTPELDAALDAWAVAAQAKRKSSQKAWQHATVVDMKSKNGQTLKLLEGRQILTAGQSPKHETYRLALALNAGSLTGVRLETFADISFAKKSLSRPPGNGNFVLSGIGISLIRNVDGVERNVEIADAVASFEQKHWPVKNALDGDKKTGWAVDGHVAAKSPIAIFRFKTPLKTVEGDRLIVDLQQNAVDYHNIGRFRLSTTTTASPGLSDDASGIPPEHLAGIDAWPSADTKAQTALGKYFRTITPLLADSRAELAKVTALRTALDKQIPETLITRTQTPREIKVLARGDWMDESGEAVAPAVPHFLTQVKTTTTASRLELADWLTSHDNPLVARVFVNRLWKLFFGKGIVKSADDFGSQGSWPTHPELLDWLSIEFRDSGWDVQHVIRLIVTSDAYRRTSVATPELQELDPFNNLLARQSRFRLDAEFIRDNALSVSGLLVNKIGGRSVKPYQPEGYWAHLNFPKRAWKAEAGEDQYRRGLYTYWCRTFLHPAMRSFDAPSREECTVDRPRSNNSLQALVLLNDPSFVEAARGLALRTINEGGTSIESRLNFVYQVCLSRDPRPNELKLLSELAAEQLAEFKTVPDDARDFLKVGQSGTTAPSDSVELAAWTAVARVILNLHEIITRT